MDNTVDESMPFILTVYDVQARGYSIMKLTLLPFLIPLPHLSPPSLSTAPMGQENWTPLKVISSATRKYLKRERKFGERCLSGEYSHSYSKAPESGVAGNFL